MTDHSQEKFFESQSHPDGSYSFKVYHYDASGNREIYLHQSTAKFRREEEALDAASDWCEENNIEATQV